MKVGEGIGARRGRSHAWGRGAADLRGKRAAWSSYVLAPKRRSRHVLGAGRWVCSEPFRVTGARPATQGSATSQRCIDPCLNRGRARLSRGRTMKQITAVIKPFKLEEVREALADVGVSGLT